MIKTATLAILTLRYLRSNRRASVDAALSQVVVQARICAGRMPRQWESLRLQLPVLLIFSRAMLGPVVIALSLFSAGGLALMGCIGLALLSDVLDGMLARRWRIDTEKVRRWDTRADTFFYACVLLAAVLRYPGAWERRWLLLAGLVAAEVSQHAFAAVKYGRHASYHSVLSKIWGLMMASAMCALLGAGLDNWFLDLTLSWGILCNLQGLAMSIVLPRWHRDVPTLFHAVRLRNEQQTRSL
jgi:phosphatidylglycerophosphate synthase